MIDQFFLQSFFRIVFLLNIGVASIVGQYHLVKLIADSEILGIGFATTWAGILIAVYAWFDAKRTMEQGHIQTELDHIKLIRGSAPPPAPKAGPKPAAKPSIRKIEFQHTIDPATPDENIPAFIKKGAS